MEKVSLILPVYKAREDWLAQCLASIKAQTYPVELIRVDEVKGAAKARNIGLKQATGDLISFCDADDYMEPDAIEKMVEAVAGVEMVCGSFSKFGDFAMTVSYSREGLTMQEVADYALGNFLRPRGNQMLSGCWAKLYRRSICGLFPEYTTAEDMAFNFNCLERCDSVRFISDVVYHNRRHGESLSASFDGSFGFLKGMKHARRFLEQFHATGVVEDALDNAKVYHSMLYAQRIGPDALKKAFPC